MPEGNSPQLQRWEKWEKWLSLNTNWIFCKYLCVCACLCLSRWSLLVCVCACALSAYVSVCARVCILVTIGTCVQEWTALKNEKIKIKKNKAKRVAELWPRVFNTEIESSRRSTEVIMNCSLTKLQLQVTSDPESSEEWACATANVHITK